MKIPADIMTPKHPRWREFIERLTTQIRQRDCGGGNDVSHSIRLLEGMGFSPAQIDGFCQYFPDHCDCEIVFNIGSRLHRKKKAA